MHFSIITIESTTKTSYISHSFHCTVFWAKRKAGASTGSDFLPYHLVVHAQILYRNDSVVQTLITLPSPEVLPHQGRLIVPKMPCAVPIVHNRTYDAVRKQEIYGCKFITFAPALQQAKTILVKKFSYEKKD